MSASRSARLGFLGLLGLAAWLVFTIACGSSDRSGFAPDVLSPLPVTDGGDAGCSSGGQVCSRDLHSVLDACSGEPLRVCPDDMGCAGGECVPACASAAANAGTIGCSFWTVPATGAIYGDQAGGCFASSIANTWNVPVEIHVEYRGVALDISKSIYLPHVSGQKVEYVPLVGPLPPQEVAVIFLSDAPGLGAKAIRCPAPAAISENPLPPTTGRARAFRVSTSLPVSAYSVFPYGGAASAISAATVLLPTSSWGTNYLMVDGWDARDPDVAKSQAAIQIVASEDDTQVSIGADIGTVEGGTVVDGGAGPITRVSLARGEVFQILQRADFTGKALESDKPIALFGGADCFDVPSRIQYCDSAQQQIPPLVAWGNEYAAVRYRNRKDMVYGEGSALSEEPVPWRLVGAADGTELTYEPARPADAPSKLALGESRIFWSQKPFVVRSQDGSHPFHLAAYMTGADSDGAEHIGDPDFVNVIPANQYLDTYAFFADVTYQYTTLTVVRQNTGKGFADVTLDCAGVLGNWKSLDGNPGNDGDRFQYTYVDLLRNWAPQPYAGDASKTCGSGRHEMQSREPFAVTVWGLAPYDSYAYPGGAGIRELSNIRVPVH